MVSAMPARLWQRWQAYHRAEQFGPQQDDLRAGIVASLLANQWRDPDKGKPAKPDDFFPSLRVPKTGVYWATPEGQDELARMWAVASGGKVIERA